MSPPSLICSIILTRLLSHLTTSFSVNATSLLVIFFCPPFWYLRCYLSIYNDIYFSYKLHQMTFSCTLPLPSAFVVPPTLFHIPLFTVVLWGWGGFSHEWPSPHFPLWAPLCPIQLANRCFWDLYEQTASAALSEGVEDGAVPLWQCFPPPEHTPASCRKSYPKRHSAEVQIKLCLGSSDGCQPRHGLWRVSSRVEAKGWCEP